MTGLISRHIVTIDGERQIHYRRAGEGSPIILLHQSPKSSEEYIPLITELSSDYTVFAPDTPGNGLSDPLPINNPSMNDFAKNVVKFMDAIGIEKCPVYGFHTGGSCTLELSWSFPERVTVGVVDGYVNMPEERVKEILENYFTPLELDWSGSHLTWIWSRFREQIIFFPWYRKDKISRMTGYSIPPPEYQQNSVVEFLRAGKAYVGPYRAAFTQDNINSIKEMKAKCLVMSSKTDVLYDGLDRMPKPSNNIQSIARKKRYALLFSKCKKFKIKNLILGHHIEDKIENFFIRMVRGSGLKGLVSLEKKTKINEINLIRPLLDFKKKDLRFISSHVFNFFVEDPANKNIKYMRIRIRKLMTELQNDGLDKNKLSLTIRNLKSSNQAITYYVQENKRVNSFFNTKNKKLILNEEFFNHPYEIVLRSLSDSIKLIGKKYNPTRGKKLDNIIVKLKENNLYQATLGGCVIKKVNRTVIITKELQT